MSEAPAFLTLNGLTEDEETTRTALISQLRTAQKVNERQQTFYEGSRRVRDLGIAIPPHLRDVEAVAAWPEIVVDVLHEPLSWRGWRTGLTGDALGLNAAYAGNHLRGEVSQATLDALICGVGFLSAGTGNDGEPDVLIKAESPSRVTTVWDPRLRRASSGLAENYDDRGRIVGWTLYLLGQTITLERLNGRLVVTDRDEHERDRIPLAVLRNRPRSSRIDGRSEITRAVRSLTEMGMRTLLGMEVAREFYGAPQRYLMGADEEMFVDQDGNKKSQWDAIIGRMLMAPRDEAGELPVPGTFAAASPQPFTEILRTLAQMLSAATGIPGSHLGFNTDNPASEGAILLANQRSLQRSAQRQDDYDQGLVELGNIAALWQTGELPAAGELTSSWVPLSVATPDEKAQRATQMITAGVLDPTWDYTLEQFGVSDDDIARVQQERLRGTTRSAVDRLASAADAARQANPDAALLGSNAPAA